MTAPLYLVAATERSGSTLLCELLASTGVAGRPEEYFEFLSATGRVRQPREYFPDDADPSILKLLAPLKAPVPAVPHENKFGGVGRVGGRRGVEVAVARRPDRRVARRRPRRRRRAGLPRRRDRAPQAPSGGARRGLAHLVRRSRHRAAGDRLRGVRRGAAAGDLPRARPHRRPERGRPSNASSSTITTSTASTEPAAAACHWFSRSPDWTARACGGPRAARRPSRRRRHQSNTRPTETRVTLPSRIRKSVMISPTVKRPVWQEREPAVVSQRTPRTLRLHRRSVDRPRRPAPCGRRGRSRHRVTSRRSWKIT